MPCPHCGQSINLPGNTVLNMETYGKSCITVTDCCGKIVQASPITTYRVSIPHNVDKITEDDWGREPK